MNKPKNAMPNPGNWTIPTPIAEFLAKHPIQDVDEWRGLIARVVDLASAQGWTKTEVAKRTNIAEGTFSQWASGKYTGILAPYNQQVAAWLMAVEDSADMAAMIPASKAFLKTSVSIDIMETLLWAQVTGGFVSITLPAGRGKTFTCHHYKNIRLNVHIATLSPNTKTVHGMLVEVADALEVSEYNPARLARAIARKLQRGGENSLLIIDEAQNALPDAINQLRGFADTPLKNVGVALVGNEETASAFLKDTGRSIASRAQVTSRFDKRVTSVRSPEDDALQLIAAWDVTEPKMVQFLLGIASKPGALRQIDRTMKLASMYGAGEGSEVTLKHLQTAWKNRNVGDIA
ncbi:MAG: DNA transposition protein [Shinella sp.]|nr:MAG: DNA transposition protein [Shinella sp.]